MKNKTRTLATATAGLVLATGALLVAAFAAPIADAASPAREWAAGDAWSVAVAQRDPAGNRGAGHRADAWLDPVLWNYTVTGETVIDGVACWQVTVEPGAASSVEAGALYFSRADRILKRVVIERRIRGDIVIQELDAAATQPSPMTTTHASFPFDWPVLAASARGMASALDAAENDSRTFASRVSLRGRRVRRDVVGDSGAATVSGMAVIRRAPLAIRRSVTQKIHRGQPPVALRSVRPAADPAVAQAIAASRTWQVSLGDHQSDVELTFAEQAPWWIYRENATMKAWLVSFTPGPRS